MPFQTSELVGGGGIPDPNRPVDPGRHGQATVGAEGDAQHGSRMAGHLMDRFAAGHVPKAHGRVVPARQGQVTVW